MVTQLVTAVHAAIAPETNPEDTLGVSEDSLAWIELETRRTLC